MPKFSKRSTDTLKTCDSRLVLLFSEVVKKFDCTIIEGYRSKEQQDQLFEHGKSKLRFPNSKHNQTPSMAVDVVPYPIDWDNRERFVLFAGYVLGIADQLNIPIRWGGDWDGDWDTKETTFFDAPHFEIDE